MRSIVFSFQVSYIKSIDMYVMGCVLFVSGAFVEYAIVLLLQHKKKARLKRRDEKRQRKVGNISHVTKRLCDSRARSFNERLRFGVGVKFHT